MSPRAERAGAALLLALLAAVAVAFALPWRSGEPEFAALERWAPLDPPRPALLAIQDASGAPLSWESQNPVRVPTGLAIGGDMRPAALEALESLVRREGEDDLSQDALLARLAGARVYRTTLRELKADGSTRTTLAWTVREPRGDFLLALYDVAADQDLAFDPPLLSLPADLAPGRRWSSEGTVAGALRFRFTGRALGRSAREAAGRRHDDCLVVETRLAIGSGAGAASAESWRAALCAGVGLVDEVAFDAAGAPTRRRRLASTPGVATAALLLPPPAPGPVAGAGDAGGAGAGAESAPGAEWSLARIGRLGTVGSAGEATIAPVAVEGSPPVVLAAAHGAGLVALDPADPGGASAWRFHPGGTVYGEPARDAARGRIYVGASDKRLHALDARGLWLWSVETGDNVAGRPLVADDLVVFGSEDRSVYAVDAATGAVRWRRGTGGPVASSPARAGDAVVVGSDDGAVRALALADGAERWRWSGGGAVEAPVVVAGATAFAVTSQGIVAALDARTGRARWTGAVARGARAAPAVGPALVFVVDGAGRVVAFDRTTGRRRWRSADTGHVGAPLARGDGALVARAAGSARFFGAGGAVEAEWEGAGTIALGPSAGLGAVWLADRDGAVWRLGPGGGGAAPIALAWTAAVTDPPFDLSLVRSTPVADGGGLVVVDATNRWHRIDPATGRAELGGTLPGEEAPTVELVVDRGVLFAVAGGRLHAVRLADGRALWSAEGGATALRPPLVDGDLVVWSTSAGIGEDGAITALDRATGRPRWSTPLPGIVAPGEAVAAGGLLLLPAPAIALDRATGAVRWRADLAGGGLAGPALSADGGTVYVATFDEGEDAGAIAAVDVASGAVRWRARLPGGDAASLLERIWLSGDVLVVPLLSGGVAGLDAATGAERWLHAPTVPRLGGVTVAAGFAVFALENGGIVALDAATGGAAGRFDDLELALSEYAGPQRPAVIGRRIVFALGPALLGLDLPAGP